MNDLTIWTKQHRNILQTLQSHGRHITRREHIVSKMEDISKFYLDVYTWYTKKASEIVPKPSDVQYPIWVSLSPDSALDNDPDTVILELGIDSSLVVPIDFDKWGYVVNYLYVPVDDTDAQQHQKLLDSYGVDDPKAYMSGFYPAIKTKIIRSWDRVFDLDNQSGSDVSVGTIWEIKQEWIKKVIQ